MTTRSASALAVCATAAGILAAAAAPAAAAGAQVFRASQCTEIPGIGEDCSKYHEVFVAHTTPSGHAVVVDNFSTRDEITGSAGTVFLFDQTLHEVTVTRQGTTQSYHYAAITQINECTFAVRLQESNGVTRFLFRDIDCG